MASVTDPLGNAVTAVNDYRALSPRMLTDPNGNRTAAETDALGIVVKTAIMGKDGGSDGDTLESPTARMEYGFAEFGEDGKLLKPSWVKTFSRETHGDGNTRWMETVEYSDGMGNVALMKTKAAGQKWIGTGRTVLNNKGNPVKQYEPYFSNTDAWESEPEMREQGVTPILHYDPLSRLTRTDFPDGTHSKVEFTAWEQRDYDRCDTAAGSPHFNTPTVTHLDSLGKAFLAIADDGTSHDIRTRTVLDIEGNEKQIIDARGNAVMEYGYGIHGERCYTKSMDAGERWMLPAADGQPIYAWDSRGNTLRTEDDELRRPTKLWLNNEKLVGETVYGTDAASNLIGKPWKIYDQSGITENIAYDFKGNLLETKRQFSQEYKQTIDWEANPAMENEEFVSTTEYDALNRATSIRTPRNSGEIIPAYDEGGLLNTVKAKLRNAAQATEFVKDITYNPKGQRERITYGNGATTRYDYDEKTFRLTKLLTTRNNGTDVLQDLNYTYDQMGNITGITDNAQQTIYFNGAVVNPSQTFEYDALYRLTKATGREHASINADSEPEIEGYNQAQLSPEDGSAMRLYQRQWQYDQVGNILALIHQANGNSWTRNYNYDNASNRLMSTEVGNADVNYTYNEHGSMASMPHLQVMEWDFAERLSHITRGTTEAYYNYDNSGQRMRKVVEKNNGSIIETRLYFGGFEIWRKRVNGNIETERETLHIMDDAKRIAVVETLTVNNGNTVNNPNSVQRYQFSNNIESATLELDDAANIISYEEYYPYGETSYRAGRNIAEVGLKRYRFTGKEKDEESGLYYYGARYYACWIGRWIATDPAGLVDGLNLYMYCRGSPVGLVDTEGTKTDDIELGEVDINEVQIKSSSQFNDLSLKIRNLSEKNFEDDISYDPSIKKIEGHNLLVQDLTLDECNSLIEELTGLMLAYNLDVEWLEEIRETLETETFKIKLVNQETNTPASFIKTNENESIIIFNVNVLKEKKSEELQAFLVHELRHLWQATTDKTDAVTGEKWKDLYKKKDISIEVDTYEVQTQLEEYLGTDVSSLKKAFLSLKGDSKEKELKIHALRQIKYDKLGYIGMEYK
jgi:RHS repeat-associated protein